MLRAGTHVELVNMIVVLTLITLDLCYHHLRVEDGILTKALIDTRPTGVATQVYYRVINPGAVGCTTLISRNLCTTEGQFGIKRCTQVDRLWEKGSSLGIGHTMVVVKAIDIRDA